MRYALIIFSFLILTGCASSPVYNPIQAQTHPELLLNEGGLKEIQEGMTFEQVHKIMGQELLIGYAFQSDHYKPLTIPNPYRIEKVKDTGYVIEYYINAIRQADGIVRDDELTPLVFQDGKLIGRGWPLVNSLRPSKPVS